MDMEFTKLSVSGNDFICVDNREGRWDEILSSGQVHGLAKYLCRRGLSVGADGIIFAGALGHGTGVDISARFFEPDGSEVDLCGNGVGAFVNWVFMNRWFPMEEIRVLTSAGVVRGKEVDKQQVMVCIPTPVDLQRNLKIEVEGKEWLCDFMVVGIPHLVIYVEDLEGFDVQHFGPLFRHHQRFQPMGINANFCQILSEGVIAIRTFEFGVENETLACGTGSSASAIASFMRSDWSDRYGHEMPVQVRVQGGETLKVWFRVDAQGKPFDVCLETRVRRVYTGMLDPERLSEALQGDTNA